MLTSAHVVERADKAGSGWNTRPAPVPMSGSEHDPALGGAGLQMS